MPIILQTCLVAWVYFTSLFTTTIIIIIIIAPGGQSGNF
jgi:hypothetical protein